MSVARCRTCDMPVVWCETEGTGKRIPVDAEPNGEILRVGGASLELTGGHNPKGVPIVRFSKSGSVRTHFISCPQADQHRRRR